MATPTETDQSPRGGGFATSTPQILQPPGRFPAQSFSDTKVQDLQANFEHGRFNPSERQDNVVEPKSGKQPETRPISHDQLVIEVKGIYAGPMPLEAKCIEADMAHRLPSTAVLRLDTTHKRSYRLQRDPVPDSVKKVAVALSILISLQLSRFKGLAKLGLKPLSSALHYSQKLIGRYDDAVKTVSAPPNSVDRRISKVNSKDRDNIIPRASQKRTAKRYKPLCQLILRLCSGGNSGFCGVTACRWVILGCFWRLAACSPLPINNLTNNDFQGDRFKPNLWADSAVLFLSVIVLVTAQTLVTLKRSPVPIWSTLMAAYAFAWWSIRSDNSASLILNSGIFVLWAISAFLYARSAFQKLQAPSYTPLVVVGVATIFDMVLVGYMAPADGGIPQADLLNLSLPSASTALSATAIALSTYRYKYGDIARPEDRIVLQDVP